MELAKLVHDIAVGINLADSKLPTAINQRSKVPFQPGIGPHSESATVELTLRELAVADPVGFGTYETSVPYPNAPRQRCDLCIGIPPHWAWAVELKMLRILGDNGKANDNILMHILSPYGAHRSALTDCEKLLASGLLGRKAIVIFGYESESWPLLPAIEAFEVLASRRAKLSSRYTAHFNGLVHPIHRSGSVFGWELLGTAA